MLVGKNSKGAYIRKTCIAGPKITFSPKSMKEHMFVVVTIMYPPIFPTNPIGEAILVCNILITPGLYNRGMGYKKIPLTRSDNPS